MGVYTKIHVPEFTLPKPLPCKTTPPPREDFSGSAYHYDIDENKSPI